MQMGEPALIGGLEPRDIRIVDYDPGWPARFQEQRRIIADALGNSLLRIEHIGSTAVPDMAAKAIIDILIVVADSADEPSYLPCLVTAGYELRVREPGFHQHRMLRTPARDVHIHVWSPDAPEIERQLAFRDRLRSKGDDRKRYEDTRRRLAALSWPDMNAYAEAKTAVIEAILASR
jgi:GrpB-like predicted nucleotidyltransferase (UPF0157 family)